MTYRSLTKKIAQLSGGHMMDATDEPFKVVFEFECSSEEDLNRIMSRHPVSGDLTIRSISDNGSDNFSTPASLGGPCKIGENEAVPSLGEAPMILAPAVHPSVGSG